MTATYTGKNVDAAIQKASEATGIAADALKYEVLAGQTGGFALIRVVGKRAQAAPMKEELSGEPGAAESGSRPRREARDDRGDRGDRGRGDRGDRRGRGDRGDRGDRRGGDRGDRRGRGDRPRREGREDSWPVVPIDGPEAVEVHLDGEVSDYGREATNYLKEILEQMGFGLTLSVSESDSQIAVDLRTEVFAEALEARDLELVQSLEHLVEKGLLQNYDGPERKKINLDVNGEKARAEIELATTAKTFAEKAIAEQKIFKLGPLDPRARRIVHLTLKTFPGVTTRSEGEGLFRRVGIIPDGFDEADTAD